MLGLATGCEAAIMNMQSALEESRRTLESGAPRGQRKPRTLKSHNTRQQKVIIVFSATVVQSLSLKLLQNCTFMPKAETRKGKEHQNPDVNKI